jgi:hypothetical protein
MCEKGISIAALVFDDDELLYEILIIFEAFFSQVEEVALLLDILVLNWWKNNTVFCA